MKSIKYINLGEFIQALKNSNEIKTISHPVSAVLEISKLTDAESKSPGGGKALFFENVKDSPFPVATNLFGSQHRICLALGVDNLDHLGDRIREIIHMSPPKDLRDMLGMLTTAFSVSRFFPRKSRAKIPPCQEVVLKGDDINLFALPILHCWPQDAGRFITLPLVITKSLSTGKRNVGMYRMQVFDRRTTGMHWHIHKDGSNYFNEYRKAGKRMPVAVAIGADPATIYAATAPMPRNVDEMILAGFIRNAPVAMTRCLTCDLEVPAEAEFILEGYVDPDELRREGPFGDHTGYYSLADDYPVFHVTAITHRKSPVYCATLVGRPPMEDCYLAKATERLFLPLLQTVFPEITDYWLPWEGVFHNIVIVSIKKEYPRHAQKVISGLWGQGQMSFCKAILVVDETVDPKDPDQVMQRLVDNFDLTTDIVNAQGILDVLDHSSPFANFGNKIGIDLTDRISGEPLRNLPVPVSLPGKFTEDALLSGIQAGCDGILSLRILEGDPSRRNRILVLKVQKGPGLSGSYFTERLLNADMLLPFNLMLFYDSNVDIRDNSFILWKLFNNVDPGRDLILREGRCVIDACKKGPEEGHVREWPDELSFD
ncbi:MAG: menaquinone biosynthesis decarboxylase [Deltaproteobacteria bacterium]|nr:menaquinone biosynthesis decarboxylase [Deltaproteobacteria bacterium]